MDRVVGCLDHRRDHGMVVMSNSIILILIAPPGPSITRRRAHTHRAGQVQHEHSIRRLSGIANDLLIRGHSRQSNQEVIPVVRHTDVGVLVRSSAGQFSGHFSRGKDRLVRPDTAGVFRGQFHADGVRIQEQRLIVIHSRRICRPDHSIRAHCGNGHRGDHAQHHHKGQKHCPDFLRCTILSHS